MSAYVVRRTATVKPRGGRGGGFMGTLASRSDLQKRVWNLALRLRTVFGQDERDLQDGTKAVEAGKAGISLVTSSARSLSNRLGFGVGNTKSTTFGHNAAGEVATVTTPPPDRHIAAPAPPTTSCFRRPSSRSASFQARLWWRESGSGAHGKNCKSVFLLQLRQERNVYSSQTINIHFPSSGRSGTVGQAGEVGTCFGIEFRNVRRPTLQRLHRRLASCRPAGAWRVFCCVTINMARRWRSKEAAGIGDEWGAVFVDARWISPQYLPPTPPTNT